MVFRTAEQACALQLLVVLATVEIGVDGVQLRGGLSDISGVGVLFNDGLIEAVGAVVGVAVSAIALPQGTGDVVGLPFAQIGEGNDITVVLSRCRLVRHPELYAL